MEWTDMMHFQQQLQKVMRSLLPLRKSLLTASECELLAHLYLQPEQNTPVLLSQNSGMKKEAVSRCLKSLYEKECIRKQRQETDERSYRLFILQPFYDLWRSSSEDFEAFMYYADKLAAHIEKGQDRSRDHEVL